MAVKTYRLGTATDLDNSYAALFESDVTAATRTDGWTVAKLAAGNSSDFLPGTKVLSSSFSLDSGLPKPENLFTGSIADAFKTPVLKGIFAATAWTLTFAVRAATASSQAGRMRLRVYKSVNANGQTPTELTTSTQVGTTSAALSTTVDATSVVTWSPGTTFTLTNEYLFFAIAWEITTASGSNSGDVLLRTGQSAGGTRIVTPNFVVPASLVAVGNRAQQTRQQTRWF